MYSCHSMLECCNLFSGVKLSIRSFCFIIIVQIRKDPSCFPMNLNNCLQFGTQVKFCRSCDHNNQAVENAFSGSWYFFEMELEPAVG